jgi:hypothetical protein
MIPCPFCNAIVVTLGSQILTRFNCKTCGRLFSYKDIKNREVQKEKKIKFYYFRDYNIFSVKPDSDCIGYMVGPPGNMKFLWSDNQDWEAYIHSQNEYLDCRGLPQLITEDGRRCTVAEFVDMLTQNTHTKMG